MIAEFWGLTLAKSVSSDGKEKMWDFCANSGDFNGFPVSQGYNFLNCNYS